jgi:cytochrome bd-type quinol oxidase subunit 2
METNKSTKLKDSDQCTVFGVLCKQKKVKRKMTEKIASWKIIILLGIFICIVNLYIFPLYQSQINEIAGYSIRPLDVQFSYTKMDVDKAFNDMEQNGRKINLITTGVIDMIYPIIYGCLFFLLLVKLTRSFSNKKIQLIFFFPMLGVLFDYSENFGILKMLNQFPEITQTQVSINSALTSSKWIFILITIVVILILIILNFSNRKINQ